MLADALRHFQQDAVNLGQFFFQQAHEFVVLLDGFQGLDEDGLAAGTGAVDDSLHAAFLLDLHGDDEAFAADGDEFVLHGAAFGEAAEISTERFLNRAALFFDLAADAGQFGRGFVFERAVGLNLVAEVAQEFGEVDDLIGERADAVPVGAHAGGGWRAISRHSAARSTTRITSRISVVSRAAPAMRDFRPAGRSRGGRRNRSVRRRGEIRESRW